MCLTLAFSLDYYTDVLDLRYILEDVTEDPLLKKYSKLNDKLIGIVEDYSLVSFCTLYIEVCRQLIFLRVQQGTMMIS